ncbi:hypothetical protein BC835DRAFT_1349407 [Cytidiella melzeri]|nr:hypothetical protein BC835DRAFT_1349407 [Cytidiella melzeri]
MRLLLTGATGVAGLNVYRAALEDPTVSKVTLLLRREMPSWAVLPANASEKTTTIVHDDFRTYSPELASRLAQHDACLWALGKSARGISEEEYTTMTHDYPMAMLAALRDAGVGEDRPADKPFQFVYWSGEGADPTERSVQMWARVKGRTENHVTEFCKSTPGMRAYIVRPGYFVPPRKYPEDWTNQRAGWESGLDCVLGPAVRQLTPSLTISVEDMSKVALEIARGRWSDVQLFRNKTMRELSHQL